jgi:hypothetical protein
MIVSTSANPLSLKVFFKGSEKVTWRRIWGVMVVDTSVEGRVWLKNSVLVGASKPVHCHDEFAAHRAAASLVMTNYITEAFQYF